jgi:hypothetical protein
MNALYIIASKFLEGAVKPWEWEQCDESGLWLEWTLVTRAAFGRAQNIVNEQASRASKRKKHG